MRTIRLAPEISSFWLMNPGILLFYDKIYFCKEDFKRIYTEKNFSSFHKYRYKFIKKIQKTYPNMIEVVECDPNINKYDKEALELVDFIFRNQSINSFSNKSILDITVKKYKKWITFNEKKCIFLSQDDDYRYILQNEHIKKWKRYLIDIERLYQYVDSRDFYSRFIDVQSAIGSFTRLLSRSLQFVDWSENGSQVYDCMFNDYIDGINIVEQAISLIWEKPYKGDLQPLYSIVPHNNVQEISYENIKNFFKNIEKYEAIRKKLLEIDVIINNIQCDNLKTCIEANKHIMDAIKFIRSKKIDYVIWVSCIAPVIGSLLSYIFPPHVTDLMKNASIDFHIHKKRYGDVFAPYIDIYGSILKIIDNDIADHVRCDKNIFNDRYDFYLNIIKKRS